MLDVIIGTVAGLGVLSLPIAFVWYHMKEQKLDDECYHIYFPVRTGGKFVGQQCSICGQFNSLKDIGLDDEDFKQ